MQGEDADKVAEVPCGGCGTAMLSTTMTIHVDRHGRAWCHTCVDDALDNTYPPTLPGGKRSKRR